ncbi:MAG TPA: hypothetical protein VNV38_14730 [Stellaceae bacterium]|jgi:hypothetical protein|nr:hypothetical protein [Stellaceae bacterium]
MALPSDTHVEMLLCDDVRFTPGGKLDITGYFPIPEIQLASDVQLPGAINLSFLFILRDGEGTFRGSFRILDPLGGELHRHEVVEFTKRTAGPHLIMFKVNSIPIARWGSFTALLEIGGGEYRRPIRVSQ